MYLRHCICMTNKYLLSIFIVIYQWKKYLLVFFQTCLFYIFFLLLQEDLSEMGRRKRVQQILESKSFCKVLESLIKAESESCKNDPNHLETLQRLSELSLPHGQLAAASLHNIGKPYLHYCLFFC